MKRPKLPATQKLRQKCGSGAVAQKTPAKMLSELEPTAKLIESCVWNAIALSTNGGNSNIQSTTCGPEQNAEHATVASRLTSQ